MHNPFSAREAAAHSLSAPLDALAPDSMSTATFGVGCFWAPDARFGVVEGVWRTRVGYAGGDRANPTYHDLGDQTECFQVDFDPSVVSYRELVDLAFASHNPVWPAHKVQYASLVLAHDDEQLAVARERGVRASSMLGRPLATRIEPLKRFWLAEDYHQKYSLRQDHILTSELSAMFGDDQVAFRESTVAAKVNGYVAGDGTKAQLGVEIDFLGLSEKGRAHLVSMVKDGVSSGSCAIGSRSTPETP